MDQARDEGGLLLFVEHRYYGKSNPFGPKASFTNEGLRFLTVEQAMADFHAITLAIREASKGPRLQAPTGVLCCGGPHGMFWPANLSTAFPAPLLCPATDALLFSATPCPRRHTTCPAAPRRLATEEVIQVGLTVAGWCPLGLLPSWPPQGVFFLSFCPTGSVAAYMRQRYPETFHAVLASSSVVKYLFGSEAWERNKYFSAIAIGRSIAEVGSPRCQQAVAAAFGALQGKLAWSNSGRAQLAAAAGCAQCHQVLGGLCAEGLPCLGC